MTPQERLVAVGAVGTAVSKFYFKHDWQKALLFGFAAISAFALITITADNAK